MVLFPQILTVKPTYYKEVRAFLRSTEATASAFSSIGWDEEKDHGNCAFLCLVNYGILEEMELDIILHEDETFFVEMYVPPVCARFREEAVAMAEKATVTVSGKYVYYAIADDSAAVCDSVFKEIAEKFIG